jgi:chemotaxis signal transduction protein
MKISVKFSPVNKKDAGTFPSAGQEWDRVKNSNQVNVVEKVSSSDCPVMVFRIHDRWFALKQRLIHRVVSFSAPRALPGKTNETVRGLVYAAGACYICFSFLGLLKITADESSLGKKAQPRLIVAGPEEERWAFPVEEIMTTTISISQSQKKHIKIAAVGGDLTVLQTFDLHGERVTLLDEETLFTALNRSLVF